MPWFNYIKKIVKFSPQFSREVSILIKKYISIFPLSKKTTRKISVIFTIKNQAVK